MARLDVLTFQTRGQTLCQLLRLLLVVDDERVKESTAADLEFRFVGPLADLDEACVLATCLLEEIPDVSNLLRHDIREFNLTRATEETVSDGDIEQTGRPICRRSFKVATPRGPKT